MLKLLRKQKFAKKIFYVLAIIIVPSFILWGSATVIRDKDEKGGKGYAGIIFGRKISFEEYLGALHAWRNELRMRFGNQAMQVENLLDSNESIWDKLILLSEAKRLKIDVNNNELTAYITSLPFLQREGVFSPELYNLFLKYSLGTPARIFEEQIRDSLKIQKLFNFVTEDTEASEGEVKDRYRQDNEQIKIKYICALTNNLLSEIQVSEQDIKGYYEENKTEFQIPIQINLNYTGIEYPAEATEEQKKEIQNKVVEIHKALEEADDAIKTKEILGLQPKETGFFSLGEAMPNLDLSPQATITLFNLKEGQISNVMETPRGPFFFQLKEKRIDYIPEFEAVKEEAKEKLVEKKAKELAKSRMENYSSQIKSEKQANPGLVLADFANKSNLPVKETDFFTRNSNPAEIEESQTLTETAFGLQKGQISQVIELNQGYFVVEVAEFKPIDEGAFEKAKEETKKILLEEKKNKSFEEYFTRLKEQSRLIDYVSMQQSKLVPTKSN